ncbi:conserved hypothetical protein [Escherichia coli]|nr:conserved hypothetical protein [Escherichia coli]
MDHFSSVVDTWQTGATMYVRYYNLTSERSQRVRYLFNQNPTHSGYTKEHTYANLYAFPATSRNLSAEAGIRGKNALPGHESPGHWSSNQSRFSQHGTHIFGEMLVTGSWSAQRVSNQCG